MENNILLGAIAGDIIGSAYEFNSTKNYDFCCSATLQNIRMIRL